MKIKHIIAEFREFAIKGNMFDLAVGVIIGTSFTKIVNSLVNDIILPPIGFIANNVDLNNLFFSLNGKKYPTLATAQADGAPTVNYGSFINNIIIFLITAWAIFLLVRIVNRLRRRHARATEPTTRECPFCAMPIPVKAVRCPECTSELEAAGA